MKNKKGIILLVLLIVSVIATGVLYYYKLNDYLIISLPLNTLLLIACLMELKVSVADLDDQYEHTIKKILKTYNPILVNTDKYPKLKGKSILKLSNIDDLIDAQTEIRKPIYFVKGDRSTAFYIINDDIFLIYFVKVDPEEKTKLEIELDSLEFMEAIDLESVSDIDKTIILKAANDKEFRLSPIRDNLEEMRNRISSDDSAVIDKSKNSKTKVKIVEQEPLEEELKVRFEDNEDNNTKEVEVEEVKDNKEDYSNVTENDNDFTFNLGDIVQEVQAKEEEVPEVKEEKVKDEVKEEKVETPNASKKKDDTLDFDLPILKDDDKGKTTKTKKIDIDATDEDDEDFLNI